MPPLLNANAVLQCAHGGMFPLAPRGRRPNIGGAPGLTIADFPGLTAAGCVFNVAGAPSPCTILSVSAGACTAVTLSGTPAVHQGISCMTSNGVPTMPCSSAGQMTVHGR